MKGEREAMRHLVDAVSSRLVLTPLTLKSFLGLSFPLMVVVIAALPLEHSFLPRQHFSPSTVPPHPGCFIHKTPPPPSPPPIPPGSCLLSFRRFVPTFYVSGSQNTGKRT